MNSAAGGAATYTRGFVRLCLALLSSTLGLIALGGLVRITGSGLGCPDWPLCHGRLIPPFELAPWIEYFHRLAAAGVSGLVVAFAAVALGRHRRRPWVIGPALAAPLLLVAQIILGRLTVLNEIPPATAWVHTAVAMAILGCVALPVCAVYPPLSALSARLASLVSASASARRFPGLLAMAALALYALLLTGAYVTRSGASGACRGFPGCGSPTSGASTLRLQDIHMLHRFTAAATGLLLGAALVEGWRAGRDAPMLRRLVAGTGLLFAVQIGLGLSNVLLALPLWSRGLHLVAAALLWTAVALLVTTVWRGRPLTPAPEAATPLQSPGPAPDGRVDQVWPS